MKQKLLKTMVLTLAVLGGASSVWADTYDGSSAVYNSTKGTNHSSLSEAISGADDSTPTTIVVYSNITLDSSIEFKSGTNASKQITLVAGADNVTIKSGHTGRLFLVSSSSAYLKIGSADHRLIIDGDNKSYGSGFISFEQDYSEGISKNSLTNVTIQNVKATANGDNGYVIQRKNSGLAQEIYKDVTFSNCSVTGTNGQEAIVRHLRDDILYLDGTINFDNCSGTSFYFNTRKGKLRGNNASDLTISNNISIQLNWAVSYNYDNNHNLLVNFNTTNAGKVTVNNGVLVQRESTTDWKVWQAYKLSVSAANAATLVLPFEATIPSGAECYTLSYTSGDDIDATKVTGGTLAANTPVLVIATGSEEGTEYVFRTTAAGNTAFSTGSTAQTSGVLTGVYAVTTPVSGDYILTNHTSGVGFRKANGTNNKVKAYHAYIKSSNVSSHPNNAPAFYNINFDGNTTAIDAVEKKAQTEDGEVYNLHGVRMTGSNLKKGIYVKNGKKFIVK